jgi:DNA-directed RNA polymerase specialized sigma24 family protein
MSSQSDEEIVLWIHALLDRFAEEYPRQARVVECRFFGGLSIAETAQVLEVSERSVKRDWTFAQAWLYKEWN